MVEFVGDMIDKQTDEDVTRGNKITYTSKQMGDACEMLIAAELTLAGVPALKAPDYWPGYDVIAQPPKEVSEFLCVRLIEPSPNS